MTIVDMEAGLEHLSRATGRHVDALLVTLEPYYKALETVAPGHAIELAGIVPFDDAVRRADLDGTALADAPHTRAGAAIEQIAERLLALERA